MGLGREWSCGRDASWWSAGSIWSCEFADDWGCWDFIGEDTATAAAATATAGAADGGSGDDGMCKWEGEWRGRELFGKRKKERNLRPRRRRKSRFSSKNNSRCARRRSGRSKAEKRMRYYKRRWEERWDWEKSETSWVFLSLECAWFREFAHPVI